MELLLGMKQTWELSAIEQKMDSSNETNGNKN